MAAKWICLTLYCFLVLEAVGVFGDRHDDDDDDDDYHGRRHDKDHDEKGGWNWHAQAGLGVLLAIICVICGLLSLGSWLACHIYTKCRKDRVGDPSMSKGRVSSPPYWSSQMVFQPELAAGFGLISDGFTRVGPGQLVRTRQDTRTTDGATWAVAMTKGKHVFEVTWPWAHRGAYAGIGVGTANAPIKANGNQRLVGGDVHTWGLDIVRRRTVHSNKTAVTCPSDGSYVPDRFLMYVDMDEGTLGFGNDVTYWGEVIKDLPKQGTQPLSVMVGATKWQTEISVLYKGSAKDGENNREGAHAPHHLAPLVYPSVSGAPPTYSEFDKRAEAPIMVKPAVPDDLPRGGPSPPPPYASPPVGYEAEHKV